MIQKGIIFDWIGTLYDKQNGIFPEARKVLLALRPHYRLGLVSLAHHRKKRESQLRESKLRNYFDAIIIATKKTPDYYQWCMREMGSTPATTTVVDDRITRGIAIGNQLGCTTCWIMNPKYADEGPNEDYDPPHYSLHSLDGLLHILL